MKPVKKIRRLATTWSKPTPSRESNIHSVTGNGKFLVYNQHFFH